MSDVFSFELERTVLEFRGADTVRFLNGQLSNDVKKLQPQIAMHACVMTAKGKLNAEVWLTKLEDGIRVDGPAKMGEELLARFERYIISDDVVVTDVSNNWKLWHQVGGSGAITSHRFGIAGSDFWLKPGDAAPSSPRLLNRLELESFRIARGIPAWGSELDANTIPVEAGLDCIDYHKGCYIGQEVISRLKSVGHVNRHLVRLRAKPDSGLVVGATLHVADQVVGTVTSCAQSLDLESVVALAYVKRAHAAPGTILATENGETLTVLPLVP